MRIPVAKGGSAGCFRGEQEVARAKTGRRTIRLSEQEKTTILRTPTGSNLVIGLTEQSVLPLVSLASRLKVSSAVGYL